MSNILNVKEVNAVVSLSFLYGVMFGCILGYMFKFLESWLY